jgi:hypothetical protein
MGYTVQVPQNLQVTFPAAFIGWHDFVSRKGDFIGYEMDVAGNIVNGVPLAAQISISQFSLTGASGYIESVNYDGRIVLANGPTLRINDPNAIYSAGYTAQPFFTADDANPSITSFSGFPMCVPRNHTDPLCPQTNRPVITGTSKQGTIKAVDPLVMAPLVPGDFVEYSGFVAGNGEHIVYNLVATNIQLTTTGIPTYIRMEAALIGVFSASADQEVGQTRFVGLTSDGTASPIRIFAIDVDPCTGATTDREITSTSIQPGAVRNKFDVKIVKPTTPGVYTREYRITAGAGTKMTKNGILAGQYVQPVTEWIQAELTTPGLAPPGNDFSGFSHLTKGLGYDDDGVLWGPLSPFPQSGVTTFAAACPPFVPPESPSSSSTTSVSSSTSIPTGESSSTAPQPTTLLTTTSTSTSTTSSAPPAATSVKVYPDVVTMPILTWVSSQSGTLTVRCVSNSTDDTKVAMKLGYTNKNGITTGQAMNSGGRGVWEYSARSIKEPTQVVCTSGLGGKITVNR